jgi:threonine/homoserine/homoserine lactone efflux protein
MPKALCIVGAVIAGLLLLIFGLDLGTGFPFHRANLFMDIGTILCALTLAYLSWSTIRLQT